MLSYTTPQEVRSILGVSSTELTDATLALPAYALLETFALEDIAVGFIGTYDAAKASLTPTAAETRFVALANLYSGYTLAVDLLPSLPMFSVQRLTDGKAEFQRQTDALSDISESLRAMQISLKYRLQAAYTSVTSIEFPVSSTFTSLLASTLAVDPVINA